MDLNECENCKTDADDGINKMKERRRKKDGKKEKFDNQEEWENKRKIKWR